MRINERLNLVIDIDRADGSTVYVHAAPISREVFEANFLVLTKTVTTLYSQGFGPAMCARVAAMMLKRTAQEMAAWDGPTGVQNSLLAEIKRLANVVMPGERGWTTLPLEEAISRRLFDPDDEAEAVSAIVFFSAASWAHKRSELADLIYPLVQTTSSNSTAFAASLSISTPAANTGATTAALSVPI